MSDIRDVRDRIEKRATDGPVSDWDPRGGDEPHHRVIERTIEFEKRLRADAGALGGVTKPEDERPADWLRSQVARSAATLDGLDPELRKTMAHRTALRNTHGGDS